MALDHRIEFFIPTRCSCTQPLDPSLRNAALEKVKEQLGHWFGGCTSVSAKGLWTSDDHGLVREDVDIVFSNASSEKLTEHRKELDVLASELAAELGQEAIGYRIDYRLDFGSSDVTICVHKAALTARRASSSHLRLARAFALASEAGRLSDADSVSRLFSGLLGFAPAMTPLDVSNWKTDAAALVAPGTRPAVVAEAHGCRVVFVHLAGDSISPSVVRAVVEAAAASLPDSLRLIAVIRNGDGSHWSIASPRPHVGQTSGLQRGVRRFTLRAGELSHSGLRRLLALDCTKTRLPEDVAAIVDKAMDTRTLSAEFFAEYQRVFDRVKSQVATLRKDAKKHEFTLNLLNRLMFIAFIEKKGWLSINGDTGYLKGLWADYVRQKGPGSNFYIDRLRPLFFEALNCPKEHRPDTAACLGDVPYLNGGLFSLSDIDANPRVTVPDESIEDILHNLFDPFDFTVSEDTPLDEEASVDPHMLGHVFERLVVNRHEKGSYYTPAGIVRFMCQEALKDYLGNAVPEESPEAIARLVDHRDCSRLISPERIIHALETVKVCDPACGSGAYLVGMMQELLELFACLMSGSGKTGEAKYHRKLKIIQNNLYGVDIDPIAVNLARLRLWLSVAVDYEGDSPPPLPNLDFKIETGDSLTGPAPGHATNMDLFHYTYFAELKRLKDEFARPMGQEERDRLRQQIEEKEREIAAWLKHKGEKVPGFDWQVRFAEVFFATSERTSNAGTVGTGFDIIVANPPYVRSGSIQKELGGDYKKRLARLFPEVYTGNSDLYVFFYIRAIQLLREGGTLAFISSNKWLRSKYGQPLRAYLQQHCRILSITDFGELPVFESATAYPMVFIARKDKGSAQTPVLTLVKSLAPPYPDVLSLVQKTGFRLPDGSINADEWTLCSIQSFHILRRMEHGAVPLHRILQEANNNIYYGIKTGCNAAFVIDGARRAELIAADPNSAQVIKPFIEGKDFSRWHVRERDLWLLFIPWHFPRHLDPSITGPSAEAERDFQEQFPAVYEHLLKYKEPLANRNKTEVGRIYEWYALQRWAATYYPEFDRPKIVYQEISATQSFALAEPGYYLNNKLFMIPGLNLFLLGILNSKPVRLFLATHCPILQGNARGMQEPYIKPIPIPTASDADRAAIEELVQKCLEAKGEGCEEWEREIDERVAVLYGLAPDAVPDEP